MTKILGNRVEIVTLNGTNLISQSKKCQIFGHKQKFSPKEMRCVKCVGKHMTIICQKTKNEKLKCVSCGEYTLLIIELMWP